jgi:alpha-glucosidase
MNCRVPDTSKNHADWWRGATLYQIYPRSFFDSNGDGIGDLNGVTARLDYVQSLGVDGIWLSPFFASPMRDFGYDVSDHLAVDPMFGTLADFDALVARAHALQLKVVIDQVWSHTAREHPWFVESRDGRDNAKADWYVWADAKPDGSPPNNWQSWMGGPAWRWEPRRGQYHLHNFLPEMPDLNFHCAEVQDAVLTVAKFWLDRGVDGFRLDTANLYFHSRELQDNPPFPPEQAGDTPVMMQRHTHNIDQPETLVFMERLRALMDRYPGRMAVAEIGSPDSLARMIEYTHGNTRLHTAYSFNFLGPRHDPPFVVEQMQPWQHGSGCDAWPAWAFSNHDAVRVATRWAGGEATSFAFGAEAGKATEDAAGISSEQRNQLHLALLASLRGTLFVYQGEELGLAQSDVPFEYIQDPYGKAQWPIKKGRDGCRTPFPWAAHAEHAGFTTGQPWLPVDAAHQEQAVDAQEARNTSCLHFTRALMALRHAHPALRLGSFEPVQVSDTLLVVRRQYAEDAVLCAFNFSAKPVRVAFPLSPQGPGNPLRVGQVRWDAEGLTLDAGSAVLIALPTARTTP